MKNILLFLILMLPFHSLADDLLKISSTYPNEPLKQSTSVTGTGFLVEANGRLFAFTAAHVSQGDKTEIKHMGKKLEVLGRLVDNRYDIEILEIKAEPGIRPFARYSGQFFINMDNYQDPEILDLAPYTAALVPEGFDFKNTKELGFFESVLGGTFLAAEARIEPGMSGSPVIHNTRQGWNLRKFKSGQSEGTVLVGIATSYMRDFQRSFIVPIAPITRLLESYLSGTKGQMDGTRWAMKEGTTYRKYPDGSSELSVSTSPAGNAETADGGIGPSHPRPRPGFEFQGSSALGLKIEDKISGNLIAIYGNLAPQLLAGLRSDRFKIVSAIHIGDTLPLLGERLFKSSGLGAGSLVESTDDKIRKMFSLPAVALNLKKPSCIGDSQSQTERNMISLQSNTIKIQISGCEGDLLEIHLDRQGRLQGHDTFQSILYVKGAKTGMLYPVDIRGLFFLDPFTTRGFVGRPATVAPAFIEAELKANTDLFAAELQKKSIIPSLIVGDPKTGTPIEIQFSPIDPNKIGEILNNGGPTHTPDPACYLPIP